MYILFIINIEEIRKRSKSWNFFEKKRSKLGGYRSLAFCLQRNSAINTKPTAQSHLLLRCFFAASHAA
ncbi:hypothetical protein DXN05_00905 [Deminuibacter soli]|uniref:Uncharacterized protein n=1 Tax=Deminuibacter soli TaxID=2291815 RepID=A0A3E1NNR3_9BACT|nr:hypothetical protein DXN05_00905 [Deminuibacter soli]